MQYGPPEKEYAEAERFCGSGMLTDEEEKACFSRALAYAGSLYSAERVTQICTSMKEEFEKYCENR